MKSYLACRQIHHFRSPDLPFSEGDTAKIGVVGSIYEDLWAPAQKALKAEGINLKIVQFSDYVTPNNALSNGEIDLNAFQHRIFLEKDVEAHNYDVKLIGNTFIIPLNLSVQTCPFRKVIQLSYSLISLRSLARYFESVNFFL